LRADAETFVSAYARLNDWSAVVFFGADPERLQLLPPAPLALHARGLLRSVPVVTRGFLVILAELMQNDFARLCMELRTPALGSRVRKAFRRVTQFPQLKPYWLMTDALLAATRGDAPRAEELLNQAERACDNRRGVEYNVLLFRLLIHLARN